MSTRITLRTAQEHCGAVSLDPNRIRKMQGQGTKADWCGFPDNNPPGQCVNRRNNRRGVCAKFKQVSVNAEQPRETQKMPQP